MGSVVAFLMGNTLLLALFAIGGGLLARYWVQSAKIHQARIAAWVAFGASSLLLVIHLGLAALSVGIDNWGATLFNGLLAALWGFFAWRDFRLLLLLRG